MSVFLTKTNATENQFLKYPEYCLWHFCMRFSWLIKRSSWMQKVYLPNSVSQILFVQYEGLKSTSRLEMSQSWRPNMITWDHGKLLGRCFCTTVFYSVLSPSLSHSYLGSQEPRQGWMTKEIEFPLSLWFFHSEPPVCTCQPLRAHSSIHAHWHRCEDGRAHAYDFSVIFSAVVARATGKVWSWRPRLPRCLALTPPCPSLDTLVRTDLL